MPTLSRPFAVVLAFAAAAARAQVDVNNLDAGRPTRLEDAYPVSAGEIVLEGGLGFSVERHKSDQALATASLLFGAAPNLQLGVGGFLSTQSTDIGEDTKSGDIQVGALYNFNQETLTVPAFAAGLTVNLPTGTDSSGLDAELEAIVTKSCGAIGFHFNAAYEFLSGTSDDERNGRYKLAFGSSVPIGAPHSTRTIAVVDIFVEEGPGEREAEILGVEGGVRYQLMPRMVVDAGVGTELTGDDRSPFFAVVGLSYSF